MHKQTLEAAPQSLEAEATDSLVALAPTLLDEIVCETGRQLRKRRRRSAKKKEPVVEQAAPPPKTGRWLLCGVCREQGCSLSVWMEG